MRSYVASRVAECRTTSPAVQSFYDGLAPSRRKEWARWIIEAKRVSCAVEALLQARKQR